VITALKVALVVILALLLVVVALRMRKLRRDEMRALEKRTDPASWYRPVALPASRGFRLLDGTEAPSTPRTPMRPRLEPDREYVFSDFHPARVDVNPCSPRAITRTGHSHVRRIVRACHFVVSAAGCRHRGRCCCSGSLDTSPVTA